MTLVKFLLSALIGSVVGFLGGFQGVAGGFYLSALLLSMGVLNTQRLAAGTTLLAILPPISLGAVYSYWKSGDVDVGVSLTLATFYTIMAYYGAQYNKQVKEKNVVYSLALLLFLTSGYFFHKAYTM
tara:strand:- start:751 stop:1131 length:381 start_codon:yes stop_codon:yes gene_type:complete